MFKKIFYFSACAEASVGRKFSNKKGFTLIELLIVISIIGILMAIGVTSYINAQKTGRDAKRKSDLRQIQSALEMYRADNDKYPWVSGGLAGNITVLSTYLTGSVKYIGSLPTDPTTGNYYYYSATDVSSGSSYNLCALLENTNDKELLSSSCGVTEQCNTTTSTNCNYGVKNP